MRVMFLCCIVSMLFCYCQRDISAPQPSAFAWSSASPESQNMDESIVKDFFDHAGRKPFVKAFVIVRNGHLVAERYYRGDKDDAHNVFSVSKSFLSALYGIALDQGVIESLDSPIMDYLSDYRSTIQDQRINTITIRHLLTMRSGFDGDRNTYFNIFFSDHVLRSILNQFLIFNPGSNYKYTTAGTHLLSAILSEASDGSVKTFAAKTLFEPLGITIHEWTQDPQGYYHGGNNMYFSARDMARLGRLYMNRGMLDDQQIVPSTWVESSLKATYTFKNGDWGALDHMGYGMLWWLGRMRTYDVYMALGHGGQFIFCFPDLDLIVVSCCDGESADWETADSQEQAVTFLVADHLLPAIKDK